MDILILSKTIFFTCALFLGVTTALHVEKTRGMTAVISGMDEKPKYWRSFIFHDRILNLFGTFLGWIATYYLIFERLFAFKELQLMDLFLIFIVFVGTTGYLPHMIINKGLKP